MASRKTTKPGGIGRRQVLKGAAAIGGLAIGSGAIRGFPAIIAAEPVTLRYMGTAVNQHAGIKERVKADLGINIEYIPVTSDDVVKRAVTQPNSFDILDSEYWMLKNIVPTGNLQGLDTKKIKQAGNITTRFFHIVLISVPILIQVYFNSSLAYGLMKWLRVPHNVAAPGALIGASNFFGLAVATAIALYGPGSGAALATVVGVLVEVPVMLSVVHIVNRSRRWYVAVPA